MALTKKETAERLKLHKLWATKRATMKQMERCLELDRKVLRKELRD